VPGAAGLGMGQHCDGVARIDRTLALGIAWSIRWKESFRWRRGWRAERPFRITCSISESASTNKYKGACSGGRSALAQSLVRGKRITSASAAGAGRQQGNEQGECSAPPQDGGKSDTQSENPLDRQRLHLQFQQQHHVRQATTHAIEKVVTSVRIQLYLAWFRRADGNPIPSYPVEVPPFLKHRSNACVLDGLEVANSDNCVLKHSPKLVVEGDSLARLE
jgi:hypothetical protein